MTSLKIFKHWKEFTWRIQTVLFGPESRTGRKVWEPQGHAPQPSWRRRPCAVLFGGQSARFLTREGPAGQTGFRDVDIGENGFLAPRKPRGRDTLHWW